MRHVTGARIASKGVAALVVLIPLLLACIVLKPNDTQVFNRPPTLRSSSTHRSATKAIQQIITFDTADNPTVYELPIMVRDRDGDAVQFRMFVDNQSNTNNIPLTFTAVTSFDQSRADVEREVIFRVSADAFQTNTCRRVELFASSAFRTPDGGLGTPEPVLEDDMAHVIWWVQVVTSDFLEVVDLNACPK